MLIIEIGDQKTIYRVENFFYQFDTMMGLWEIKGIED